MLYRLAAIAALVVGIAGPAASQTLGYADAIVILANSCGQDIERYCKTATLANFEIGQCLQQNQSKLSTQCKTDAVRVAEAIAARAAAQAEVPKLCDRDIQHLCKLVRPTDGYVLQCLLKAEPSVSARCNEAITDAGYR